MSKKFSVTWSNLSNLKKIKITAIYVTLFIYPIIVELFRILSFEFWQYICAIIGGLLFVLCRVVFFLKCPSTINNHITTESYTKHCIDTNIDAFEEFKSILSLNAEQIKKMLGRFDYLYPLEKGLRHSRNETIIQYSKLSHKFFNEGRKGWRWSIMTMVSLSIPLIFLPPALRIFNAIGELL